MTLKQAASALNISVATARRWTKDGRLEASIVNGPHGNAFDISQEAIDKAKDDHRVPMIIQSVEPAVPVAEMKRIVMDSMKDVIDDVIQGLRDDRQQENMQRQMDLMMALNRKDAEIATLREEIATLRGVIEGLKTPVKKRSIFGRSRG